MAGAVLNLVVIVADLRGVAFIGHATEIVMVVAAMVPHVVVWAPFDHLDGGFSVLDCESEVASGELVAPSINVKLKSMVASVVLLSDGIVLTVGHSEVNSTLIGSTGTNYWSWARSRWRARGRQWSLWIVEANSTDLGVHHLVQLGQALAVSMIGRHT
jgi:hypothetical protein